MVAASGDSVHGLVYGLPVLRGAAQLDQVASDDLILATLGRGSGERLVNLHPYHAAKVLGQEGSPKRLLRAID